MNASQDSGQTVFPTGNYTFTVISSNTAFQGSFGWYALDEPTQLHPIVSNSAGASNAVQVPVNFGLYANVIPAPGFGEPYTLKSQPQLNGDGSDHFLTFDTPKNGTAIGLEDWVDGDFNDGVLLMAPTGNIPAPSQVHITINSVDLSDNPVNGVWTVIRSADGTVLKTGFTPLTFTGTFGTTFRVSVANYDGKVFHHWQDGSAERTRTVGLTANTTSTAVYDTGDSLRGFTPLAYTEKQPNLTVNATTLGDSRTLHMWAIIDPQSTNSSGTTYKVYAGNYQDIVFDHWSDGSRDRIRTLTIGENTTITAFYQTASIPSTQSVVFAQKTVLQTPGISKSLRGVDAHLTCLDGSHTDGYLFDFSATRTGNSTVSGSWLREGAPGVPGRAQETITRANITSINFRLEGTWTNNDTFLDCGASSSLPSTAIIEGSCISDALVTFAGPNGLTGSFRGNVTCTV